MKIIGIIIIIICLILNGLIGSFLYTKTNTNDISQINKDIKDIKEHRYDKYGFAFNLDSKFKSGQSDIDKGLIDYLYLDENNSFPNIQVYFTPDRVDAEIKNSEEYKKISEKIFSNMSKDINMKYFDGGIILNDKSIKMYYDIYSALMEGHKKRTKEYRYTFIHNQNEYQIIWQDYEDNFDESVKVFPEIINSVYTY